MKQAAAGKPGRFFTGNWHSPTRPGCATEGGSVRRCLRGGLVDWSRSSPIQTDHDYSIIANAAPRQAEILSFPLRGVAGAPGCPFSGFPIRVIVDRRRGLPSPCAEFFDTRVGQFDSPFRFAFPHALPDSPPTDVRDAAGGHYGDRAGVCGQHLPRSVDGGPEQGRGVEPNRKNSFAGQLPADGEHRASNAGAFGCGIRFARCPSRRCGDDPRPERGGPRASHVGTRSGTDGHAGGSRGDRIGRPGLLRPPCSGGSRCRSFARATTCCAV